MIFSNHNLAVILLVLFAIPVNAADGAGQKVTLDGKPAPADIEIPQGDKKDYSLKPNQMPYLEISLSRQQPSKGTIMICPGGAYNGLAGHEGRKLLPFFNDLGYDAAVLYYHVRVGRETRKLALEDALKAWNLINTKGKELGLNPKKMSLIGFSAGGHLSAATIQALATLGQRQPDRTILVYPAYLDQQNRKTKKPWVMPPIKPTGKLCIAMSAGDVAKWVASSKVYFDTWKAAGGNAEYHSLKTDKKHHGYGLRSLKTTEGKDWPALLKPFLEPGN